MNVFNWEILQQGSQTDGNGPNYLKGRRTMQAYRDSTDICNTKQVGNDPSPSSKILNIQSVIHSKLCYLRTRLAFQG